MDGRLQTTRPESLSRLATPHLGRPSLRRAFEDSHLRRDISLESASSQQSLQCLQPDLSQLGSQMKGLGALESRVGAPVFQPGVHTTLLQRPPSQVSKPDRDDAHSHQVQRTKVRDWKWCDDQRDVERDDSGRRDLRTVRTRHTEKFRPAGRKRPQVPSGSPHIGYLLRISGSVVDWLRTSNKIWENPDESSSIIIRREIMEIMGEYSDDDATSQTSEDVLGDQTTESTPHNGLQDTNEADSMTSAASLEEGLHDEGNSEPNNKGLSTTIHTTSLEKPAPKGSHPSLQLQSRQQRALHFRPAGVDIGISTLKPSPLSSKAALNYMSYTISEDRSGDAGSVIRRLLSALASQRMAIFFPDIDVEDTGINTALMSPFRVLRDWDFLNFSILDFIRLPSLESDRVFVNYENPIFNGRTYFPRSLVCEDALKHLGYTYKELHDRRVEIPLALSPGCIEEIVVLSRRYFNDAEPNKKTNMVVNVALDDLMAPICSYSRARTEIPSRCIHTKALVDLGYSFRLLADGFIKIDKALSNDELGELCMRSGAIREHEMSYSLVSTS